MNILHVNNVANVSSALADAQRAMGHEVLIANVDFGSVVLNYRDDWRFYDGPGLLRRAAYRAYLWSLLRWADVVHAHGGFWNRGLARIAARRTFILHYHGDDARYFPVGQGPRRCERLADAIFYSTPDLKSRCPKGARYVPNPVRLREPRPDPGGDDLIVAHATAIKHPIEQERVKGTQTIRRAVEKAGARFLLINGVSHGEALESYKKAHISVCGMKAHWYGVFALEAMSMGIPTLNLYSAYDQPYGAYPVTEASLPRDIQYFRGLAMREAYGSQQRNFIAKHHDAARIAKEVQRVYEDA